MVEPKGFTPIAILIMIIVSLVIVSVMIILPKEKVNQREMEEFVEDDDKMNWQWLNSQKKLFELTPTEVDLILEEIWQRFPKKEERLKVLAILRLNTPYQLGCLGEESGRDQDPLFRLDVTDCTAFILTNTALLHSKDLEEAQEMMKSLNYRTDKDMTFGNRLHFTTDRNITSPYFSDVTEEIAGMDRVIKINLVLNKIKEDGNRLIDINWEKEIVLKYIPNRYITKDLIDKLPKSVGMAFIRKGNAPIGLDIAHEGFLFDNQLFLHASLVEKKVVGINFWDYYFTEENYTPRFDGVIFFEIR